MALIKDARRNFKNELFPIEYKSHFCSYFLYKSKLAKIYFNFIPGATEKLGLKRCGLSDCRLIRILLGA